MSTNLATNVLPCWELFRHFRSSFDPAERQPSETLGQGLRCIVKPSGFQSLGLGHAAE